MPYRLMISRLLVAAFSFVALPTFAGDSLLTTIKNDQSQFYTNERWLRIGTAFGVGAIFANSKFDEDIQTYHHDHIKSKGTDRFAKDAKTFGEGKYLIPLSLALTGLSAMDEQSAVGNFGQKTLRAYIVGGLPVLAAQRLTGAGRPGEYDYGSDWRPFNDNNGVSGHAFVGAVPFLVLGRTVDNPFIKYALFIGSFATPYSRVNDDDHFFSQAMLGWYLAYEATGTIFEDNKNQGTSRVSMAPIVGKNTYGINISATW